MNGRVKREAGSLIISLMFIVVGLITLYDTTGYSDIDSQIFPRTAAIMLILTAGASCVLWVVRPAVAEGFGSGSWWRRIFLVGTMLAAALAMPRIGFLPAAALIFIGGLVSGMHDRWNGRTALLYAASSAVIVIGFFFLFSYLLNVPLP